MSRYSSFIVVFLLFFALGCSAKSVTLPKISKPAKAVTKDGYQNPDFYYLAGLDCEYQKDYACSAKMYLKLYKLTRDSRFLEDSLRSSVLADNYDIYKEEIVDIEKNAKDNSEVAMFLLPYYMQEKSFVKAEELVKSILKKDKSLKNYQLLASLYIDMKKFDKAENILKEYENKHGCEPAMCSLMLFVKSLKQDVDGTIKVLKKLYKKTKKPAYEEEIVKVLVSAKRFDELDRFVSQSVTLPKDLLLDIYTSLKMYNKAETLATKYYHDTKDSKYLAYSAIYLYEGKYLKNRTKLLDVIERFEKSVDKADDALFYNYFGYLLIDHDIDVKKGIKYVKKALKKESKNEYYLDSLAWGYFKVHECKKAYDILKKLNNKEQVEIKEHIDKVKGCLNR